MSIRTDYRAAHKAAKDQSMEKVLRALLQAQINLRSEHGITEDGEKQFSHALNLIDQIRGYEAPSIHTASPLDAFLRDDE